MEVDAVHLSISLQGLQSMLSYRFEDELGLLWPSEKKDKLRLQRNLSSIGVVLEDAERLQLSLIGVRDWLQKVKDAVYDAEDVVDKLGAEALRLKVENKDSRGKKVRNFLSPSNPLAIRFKTAQKMQKLMNRFDDIVKEMIQFHFEVGDVDGLPDLISRTRETFSSVNESKVLGRDREKEELIHLLFDSENDEVLSVIPIVGLGGMGKTTLAQLVYNDDRVKCSFEIRMWVYVSEVFDVKRLLQEILQSGYGSFVAPSSLDQLHTRVRETLSGKRYLLVLDDVWNEDYENWSRLRACLKCGAMGSKIFVTTRSDTVASIMGTLGPHHLGALSEQDSWSLFKSMARPHPNFVSIGREIAAKCNGVPLALKALAGILAFSDARESWENVRRSNVWDTLHDHGFEVENVDSPPDLISQTRETSSIVIESEVLGRDSEKEELIHLLFDYENYEVLSVIPIVGLGGMGKTTLAQLVYNDVRVQFHFDIRKWVYVSEVFDVKRLLQEILQSGYGSFVAPSSLDQLHTRVRETLSGKRYLLVLDDVWNEDYENWSRLRACLNCGAMGSKILVTTRNDTVASIMGTLRPHHLGALSEQDSWSLFRSLARPHPNFVSIGREIAAKCNGVPLALKALARMLASSNARENWEKVRRSDVWDALRDQGGILPALKLSYDHLTPSLKQCFRYCAIFPKGCQIDKNKLIKQWIAHNFIYSGDGTEFLEEEGDRCFKGLLTRSLFQVKAGTNDVDVRLFNMHDLVHDLLKYISEKECIVLEASMQIGLRGTRHLSLKNCEWAGKPENLEALKKCEKMHSMFLCCPIDINVCSSLMCLRVLDLSFAQIKYLPNSIDKLKQLRYLDVSSKWVTKLPETMCNLHCLQTLILLGCPLEKLPKNMKRMISLRHIEFDAATKDLHLPTGIGELTCLRTLPKFVVGEESGHGIEELKCLNQLSGDILIEGLDKIRNGEHAYEANLKGKRLLHSLELSWPSIEALANTENKAEEVIENLEPHSNLKKLIVDNYMGLNFPSWMMELSNLVGIKLSHCNECVHLPPLGQLRFLESLEIKELNAVKYIVEFDRSHNYTDIFPSLKELYICDMANLEGWSSLQEDGHGDDWGTERDGQPIYRCLHLITIYNCPNMTQLPNPHLLTALECLKMNGVGCNKIELPLSRSLKEVMLSNMRNLERCSAREVDGTDENDQVIFGSLRTLSISDCPKLIFLPALHLPALEKLMMSRLSCEKIEFHTSQSLKIVSLADMPSLESWSPQKVNDNKQATFPVLKLEVQECPRMVCLPNFLSPVKEIKMYQANELLLVSVANFTPLAFLSIRGIPGVKYLPKELGPNHANLHTLEISDCPKLMSLSYQLKNLSALKELTIEGCNDLVLSLSGGLQEQQQSPLLSSLEVLKIVNSCDKQTSLPGDGIILNSLRELNIRSCGNLKSLSSVGIKNLTTLIIFDCSRVWSSTKWLGELSSLRNLIASSCPDMTNFPESIGNLTSLDKLRIEDCRSLTSLPQSIGALELLRNLTIANCPGVTCFPHGLERLRNLQELSLDRCPDLKRVLCENGRRGEDWLKVAHVRNISIDGQNIRVYLSREESSGESEEEVEERPSLFGCARFNAKLLHPSCSSSSPP
ncbi:hypothetical protein AAC387_Pa11g0093 [Persea americana]